MYLLKQTLKMRIRFNFSKKYFYAQKKRRDFFRAALDNIFLTILNG